ncbi:TRAP transporter substrate-binding protein [Acidobacteriota bacterium]
MKINKNHFAVKNILWLMLVALFGFSSWIQAKDTVIKLATSSPINKITLTSIEGAGLSSEHTAAVVFKRIVERRTEKAIKVNIYPNSQLGDEPELWQSLQQGIIQMSTASCSPLANFVPEWMAFSIPYLIESPEILYEVLQGQLGRKFQKLVIDKIGVRILAWSFLGFRHFTNDSKVIRSPADLKGMKIRVIQTPDMVKLVEGFGAQAVPINWSELYSALQQGVVDGEENPFSMIQQAKLYEVQKYITTDGHRLGVLPISINEKFYKSLSLENRKIVKDTAMRAAAVFRAQLYLGNTLWIEDFQKKGVKIYSPEPQEMEQFRSIAHLKVIPYIRDKIGNEWVDAVLKAVKLAEKEYFREK